MNGVRNVPCLRSGEVIIQPSHIPISVEQLAKQLQGGEMTTNDPVNHPSHYMSGFGGHEVIDITEWLSFNLGCVVKYCCRAGRKDPAKTIEDLQKAEWYIRREIQRLQGVSGYNSKEERPE